MLPGDRLICAFLKPQVTGVQFEDWPLHVTVVPWFRLEISSEDLAAGLRPALAGLKSFRVQAAATEPFGNRHKLANLTCDPTPFIEIEKRVRALLKKQAAWLVDETTKRHRQYRPHITHQKSGRLKPGDTFSCDSLYIVEQNGGYKEVIGKVELKHGQQAKA